MAISTSKEVKEANRAELESIERLYDIYAASQLASDAGLWLSIWDEEGIQMPPGMPAWSREVMNKTVPPTFKPGVVFTFDIHIEELIVAGPWAYARGTYNLERLVDETRGHVEGKFLTILKRQASGSWKFLRDGFNLNHA